jgi:PAS domain S-box-containing protein
MPQLDIGVLNQPERLAALRRARLLFSSSSTPIDGLVRLGSRAVAAPIGLLALVDHDRLHIVGGHGLPSQLFELGEAPQTRAFCQYVVSDDAPLMVSDARSEPGLRHTSGTRQLAVAYVGQPVHDAKGRPLGAVCVIDTVPRQWTGAEVDAVGESALLLEALLAAEDAHQEATLRVIETEAVLETTLEAFIAIELTGEIIKWNRAAERTFGWSAAEAIGASLEQLIVPERFRASHRGGITRLAHGGAPRLLDQRLQLWALHRDGREFPVELTLNLVDRPQGRYAHAFVYDISERVTAERELYRQRRFLQALVDSVDVGVVACDDQGRTALINHAMRDITGGDADGAATDRWAERYAAHQPDGSPMAASELPLARAFSGETVRDAEFVVSQPGARQRIFLANGQPIRDADGARLGAVVALHEVTDRRRAQRFLECELAVTKVLEEATSIEVGGRGVLAAVATTLRWPHGELWLVDKVGNTLRIVAHWTDPQFPLTDFLPGPLPPDSGLPGRAWITNQAVWIPDISEDPDLTGRHALAEQGLKVGLAAPIRDADGVTGVLSFFGDAAEPLEQALMALLSGIAAHIGQFLERRRAEELAQLLVRTKDEFITLVGHELRTPLTSISSYTDLLLSGPDAAEDREHFLGVIARNAESLRVIIDDLLDLAGLESGYVTINERPLDFAIVVRQAIDGNRVAAQEKGLRLDAVLPATATPVSGDGARLRKVIDHVVGNAVKYTPTGGRIGIDLTRDSAGVALRISDTGIGVPSEERERLFQRFFRGSNIRNEGIPGTGLGLAISRTVIERHGGTITVNDNGEAPGTTFVIRLPTLGAH